MAPSSIDYAALAKKNGATSTGPGGVDYVGIAAKFGGATDTSTQTAATPDFTTNPHSEGTYLMRGGDDGEFVGVPYGRVMDAAKSGYKITSKDRARFASDRLAEMKKTPQNGRFLTEGEFRAMELPDEVPANFGLWSKLRDRVQSATAPTPAPQDHSGNREAPASRALSEGERFLGNTAKRVGATLFGVADMAPQAFSALTDALSDDPRRSLDGQERFAHMNPAVQITDRLHELKSEMKSDPALAGANLTGDVIGLWLAGKATEKALNAAKRLPGLRTGAQTVVGAGTRNVETAVKTATESADKNAIATGEANKSATETTLRKRGAIDKSNASAQAQTDARNEAGRQQVSEENLRQLEREGNERLETMKANRSTTKDYEAKVEQVKADNRRILDAEKGRQRVESDLATGSNILDRKIQMAEKKATIENNVAWDVVRDKTKGAKVDIGPLKRTVEAAAKHADPTSSPLFDSILREDSPEASPVIVDGKIVSPQDANYDRYYEIQYGEPVPLTGGNATFDRLQRWYSYVSDRMFGPARLESGTYNALKMVRTALDGAMQTIAQKAGAADELATARKLHTAKMDTFSNSPNQPATVASKSLADQSPEYVKEEARKERLAKVARYDPTIAMIAHHVENLRGALKAMPKPREFGQLPQRPEMLPKPKAGPLSEFTPATFMPKEYGEPAATKPIEVPELNTKKMRDDFINSKLASWTNVSRFQLARLVAGPLGTLVAAATGHPLYEAAGLVYSAAEMSPFVLQKMLDKPGVREWFTRPPAGELDTLKALPKADRISIIDGMNGLLREAARQHKPVTVTPAVAAFLATSSKPVSQRQRDLEAIRDRYASAPQ